MTVRMNQGSSYRVDLHTHSFYSDGTLSPEELMDWAASRQLDQIALTDHDGIGGIPEARDAAVKRGIDFIPGIEFSAEDEDGSAMHILGYHINCENKELNQALLGIRENRRERNDHLLRGLKEMGYPLEWADFDKKGDRNYLGKPDFARAMLKKGYIREFGEAFEPGKLLGSSEIRKIRKKKIQAREAIRLILEAGGIPVLAHPMKVSGLKAGESLEKQGYMAALEKLVIRLKSYGLKGLECLYPEHTPEETAALIGLAEKYKLHITSGSDYHGPTGPPDIGREDKR